MIYTVPLRLAREFGPQLGLRYDQDPFVLPMVMVRKRHSPTASQKGIDCMKRMLATRMEGRPLSEVFDEDALDFLVRYSGGNPRHLMMFAQNACANVDKLPIGLKAVQRATSQTVRSYSTSIREAHWQKLAQLDLSDTHTIENKDTDHMEMLENQSILEYLNGSNDNPFESFEPWYVVHPIVRELKKFKLARTSLQDLSG